MRTLRQPAEISSTLMRIGRKGGYSSNSRASGMIPLRAMNRMNRCINGIGDLFVAWQRGWA
jgi:hypothetical protein